MKVVGIRHQVGEFQGNHYDNYGLYCVDEQKIDPKMQFGTCPSYTKVKSSVLHQVVAPDKVEKLIGRELMFYFDAYKNVVKVEVL